MDKPALQKLTGNDHPTILFASRIVWEKNLDTLFRIYDSLKSRGTRFNLVMAGDGTARKDCELRMPNAIFTGKLGHDDESPMRTPLRRRVARPRRCGRDKRRDDP